MIARATADIAHRVVAPLLGLVDVGGAGPCVVNGLVLALLAGHLFGGLLLDLRQAAGRWGGQRVGMGLALGMAGAYLPPK